MRTLFHSFIIGLLSCIICGIINSLVYNGLEHNVEVEFYFSILVLTGFGYLLIGWPFTWAMERWLKTTWKRIIAHATIGPLSFVLYMTMFLGGHRSQFLSSPLVLQVRCFFYLSI